MPQARYTADVDRPVSDVFSFVADGEKCPLWRPGVIDIKHVSGTGLGARYAQGVMGPMGRRIAADYEITVFEPDRRIEFQTVAGPARPHGRFDFQPSGTGTGTRLTLTLDATLTGIRKVLMTRPVQRTMDAEVKNLDNLKRVLES
jgi:uncharacterized protein YndB with AHSA1/START domain